MHLFNRWFLIGTFIASQTISHAVAVPETNAPHVVVMISLDGLAAHYLDDPKANMPVLRALAADGARAKSMKASTPTVTWPNHTTLVTGDNPARHGVLGNNYLDRATGKKVTLISDPVYDKDEIVKVPTLYDVCKEAGMKTAALRWPATRHAKNLDWTIPDMPTGELAEQYSSPALLEELARAGLAVPAKKNAAKSDFGPTGSPDNSWTKIFNLVLHEDQPGFALLHLTWVDHTEHMYGPNSPEAYTAVNEADTQVGRVWEELKRDYPGRATLVVVSDHGFSSIKKQLLPNIVLKNAGFNSSQESPEVQIVSQGGSEFVYIRDTAHQKEIAKRIRKAFTGVEGIQKVVGSEDFHKYGVATPDKDPHVPDMILFAKDGYAFGDTANGALPFNDKPERKGSHGHDASLPNLHATFVAWGEGIKHGVKLGEISNTEVAPTLAKLLKVNLPDTDGKPLTKILAK